MKLTVQTSRGPRQVEHYGCRIEWWPGDDPLAHWTLYYDDGTYTVLPGVVVGPFDTLADVMRTTTEKVDIQLALW